MDRLSERLNSLEKDICRLHDSVDDIVDDKVLIEIERILDEVCEISEELSDTESLIFKTFTHAYKNVHIN